MGISDTDTVKNPRYFRFVCKKTTHFANVCEPFRVSYHLLSINEGRPYYRGLPS